MSSGEEISSRCVSEPFLSEEMKNPLVIVSPYVSWGEKSALNQFPAPLEAILVGGL
jgi:hypothetical protein